MTEFISIVIPVYNSAGSLAELFRRIDAVMVSTKQKYQVIFVDDGSHDGSWKALMALKSEHPEEVIAVRFSKNFGQHNAILCGFHYCRGEAVITMDDDLQHPPEEIPKLLQKYRETDADVVYGIPITKQHSMVRNAASRFVSMTSEYSKKSEQERGSSFRLLKRSISDEIKNNFYHNSLFLDAVINWNTGNIERVNVAHHAREKGRSGYSVFKLASIYFNILINYSATPLKLMTYGGLSASGLSVIFAIRFIYKKLMHNVPLGYTSLMVSILFSTGLILFCLGIIGQYLYKIYVMQNKKPPYSIKQVLK